MHTPEYADATAAAAYITQQHAEAPRVAVILGTGLGSLADHVDRPTVVPYADIPHFPRATVAGHTGQLVLGRLHGVPVAMLQGRFHLYEGYTPRQIVQPVRALGLLGTEILIVTNAAGGLGAGQRPGSLLLIRDHIGLPTMSSQNPLVGPNDAQLGPRFPPMADAYDVSLRETTRRVAERLGLELLEGTYAMVSGPNYETGAELRFLRIAGADAVGMSTVPEVIAARHMAMRVLAISCITNIALPADSGAKPTEELGHEEVVAVAERAGKDLAALIAGVIQQV